MNLLLVELTRLRLRRAILLLLLAGVALPVLLWAGTTWDTRPVTDAEIAQAKAMAQEELDGIRTQLARCEQDPEGFAQEWGGPIPEDLTCAELVGMPPDLDEHYLWFLDRQPLEFVTVLGGVGIAASVLVVVMALLIGATFAGADWTSGSMSNQLLFESRRLRVWLAKGGAVLVAGFVMAVVAMAVFFALFAIVIALRDIDVPADQWREAAELVLRAALVAAASGLGGYALAMLFRSTIATLGLLLVVVVGSSLLISAVPFFNEPERWMVHANGLAVLQDGYEFWPTGSYMCMSEAECAQAMIEVPLGQGAAYLGVALLVAVVASVVSFRRRDVP